MSWWWLFTMGRIPSKPTVQLCLFQVQYLVSVSVPACTTSHGCPHSECISPAVVQSTATSGSFCSPTTTILMLQVPPCRWALLNEFSMCVRVSGYDSHKSVLRGARWVSNYVCVMIGHMDIECHELTYECVFLHSARQKPELRSEVNTNTIHVG